MTKTIPLQTFLIMPLLTLLGGVLVGVVLFFSAELLYLICLSPIIAGFVAGGVLYFGARWSHLRKGAVVMMFGIVMGLITFGVYHYGEYIKFQRDIGEEFKDAYPGIKDDEIADFTQLFLDEEVGQTGFIGFMQLQAQEGMTISSTRDYSNTGGTNMGAEGTYGYWALELLILAFVAGATGVAQTSQPYCEDGSKWLVMKTRGYVGKSNMDHFMKLLGQGNLTQAVQLIEEKPSGMPRLDISMGRCESYSPEGRLKITLQAGKNSKSVLDKDIPSDVYDILGGSQV